MTAKHAVASTDREPLTVEALSDPWPRVAGMIDLTPQLPRDWQEVTVEQLQELLAGLHRL